MIRAGIDEKAPWIPATEEERDQVRQQMHRLLNTSHFKNSRRYPALFRFIVEETLEGRGEFLKERLLGVRVFNRPPDYDTANDPIVRVTIAEIRKRIAQYYHEEAHDNEMRIELMPGRYEPEFYPPRVHHAAIEETGEAGALPSAAVPSNGAPGNGNHPAAAQAVPVDLPSDSPPISPGRSRTRLSLLVRWGVGLGAAVLLALVAIFGWQWAHPLATEELWKPLLAAHQTVTLCLPAGSTGSEDAKAAGIISSSDSPKPSSPVDGQVTSAAAPSPTFLDHEHEGENVVFSDALATLRISNWLAVHDRESRLRLGTSTTLDDLQQGPDVLIGGLDNGWTLRAIAHLRYRFAGDIGEQYWITDTKNPSQRDWEVNLKTGYPAFKHDFALIARIHDESTGQVQMIVAGIGMTGTAAAGEFLVDANQLEELRRKVGPGFRNHDFEAVLGMDVVNGIAGSPKILAVEVW
ncbi:hypothetical protein HNQ77_000790 [Silvibacterium bohemicum]|uniref:Uncharacterized protein n=1 Tax=Silvibacterium bohemicum TaxID=1577686 RepID=A0A841JN98_9BACT|nr:hypothetical protein [Silvibacterium bohemicum]MBB6142852.1 hypothetical protein [Silvibacterium bohemicum]